MKSSVLKRVKPFGVLIAIACFLLLTSCQAVPPTGLTVQVERIVNGRELEVAGVVGQPEITERVRLEGIDVPELAQTPWGEAAKAQLERLIGQQTIVLEADAEPRDPSGQRLAYVWHNQQLLNEQLVAEGYALVVPHPPNSKYDRRLAHAQDRARVLGLGIWNPQNPLRQAPNEFRQ